MNEKKDKEFNGIHEEFFKIIYGNDYENTMKISLSDFGNKEKIIHSLFSEIKLLNNDLEIPNSTRKRSKTEKEKPIFMNFILALDSSNNLHF